jgi:ABC-type Fe3+ transport system substrate-binding protein
MNADLQKIVDGAKAEKALVIEMGPTVFGGQITSDAFKEWAQKTYGIDVAIAFNPGGPFGVIGNKIATEFRAGQPSSVDIWAASPPQYDPLLKLDMFRKVPWTELFPARITSNMIEADGFALAIATGTPGILYNMEKGPEFAKVRVVEDLLKPEYKGKFGTTAFANGFDALAAKSWLGEEKTLALMEKIAKQAQGIINCGTEDRVASGEFLALVLDCGGGGRNYAEYKGKLGLNIVSDAAQLQYYEILIPKHGQHPNAAILFALFLATPEGQRSMNEVWGVDLDYYPETDQHKVVADLEAKGIKYRRINYPFWLENPGISESGNKLARAIRSAMGQ